MEKNVLLDIKKCQVNKISLDAFKLSKYLKKNIYMHFFTIGYS